MPSVIDYGGAPNEIYRNLRDRILKGDLESGDQIKIDAVSKEFGVSIIPVREAIRMLASDHLIEILPRRSPVVSGLSPDEVLEICQVRLALEPIALAAAIPNMTTRTIKECDKFIRDYSKSKDTWKQVELNRKFHLTLYEPSGLKRINKIIASQYDGMTRYAQAVVIRSVKEVDKSNEEHQAILSACVDGDVDAAVKNLQHHLEASRRRIEASLTMA